MRVAVIGAGWSGLAASVALTQAGAQVQLLDMAPAAGGRARRVELNLGDRRYSLDNGQHLLIGAYRQTLALMRTVGVDPDLAFERRPFALVYPDGVRLRAVRAPAPLHLAIGLLLARGLSWRARMALALAVERFRRSGWQCNPQLTAARLLADAPPELIERVWQPLCVAALNVRLAAASAQIFLTVLRDSLGADADAADLLLPRSDLSRLLPDAACQWLAAHGAQLRLRTVAQGIAPDPAAGWSVATGAGPIAVDTLVLAVPPPRAATLLHGAGSPAAQEAAHILAQVPMAPICTVYLRYASAPRLAQPIYALREAPEARDFGQWLFDRGALEPALAGVLSVVISAAGAHVDLTQAELAAAVSGQLRACLGLPAPVATRVIEEKNATIVPGPGLKRPACEVQTGLLLAADAADSDYPSTIEGAVRAGQAAAAAALRR